MIEKRQSFSDAPLTTCEQCGGSLRKVFHPVGIVFKGSGWYVTDSRSSSSTAVSGNGAATTKPAEGSESSSKPAENSPSSKPAETSTTSTSTTSSASSSKE